MDYVLGIDQGGTKTMAAVADLKGTILGYGVAGGGYHAIGGLKPAIDEVEKATQTACRMAGIQRPHFVSVSAGMTGADFDYEYEILRKALGERISAHNLRVVNDCIIAMRAGSASTHGAVLCAGTGLNCAIRSFSGEEFIYGYYIDDFWQGAASISERALRAVLDASVGLRPETTLATTFFKKLGVKNADELLHAWIKKEIVKTSINALAPLVDEQACLGDAVAIKILAEFGIMSAKYAITGLERFGMLERPTVLVLSGSVFKSNCPIVGNTLRTEIHANAPLVEVIDGKYEPVVGGVLLALEALKKSGLSDGTLESNIERSASRFNLIRKALHSAE
ncbi:N-acetylglucosamine kinase [Treponema sp.]